MSDSQTVLAGAPGFESPVRDYQLSDDLAKLCLPQEWRDSYRTLAWVNSICALFLLVGLVGLKAPKVIVKPLSEVQDVVPVVFTPPEEPPPRPTEVKEEEPQEERNSDPVDTPQVVTVVAAADPTAVAFAVPVQGAVAVAPTAVVATPPPPVTQQKPQAPTQFNPNAAASEGSFPPPEYPATALRNRYQGVVVIEIRVDGDGKVASASVFKSSGFNMLDEAALQVVKSRWRFTPGKERWLHWACTFKMQ